MIVQCKGKDLAKLPKTYKITNSTEVLAGIKYDGNYIQIHKFGKDVKFYTSGNKEFYIKHVADDLVRLNPTIDFIIEAEYIAETDGRLGSRGFCTTTTFRTNFEKGLPDGSTLNKTNNFKVFDCLYFNEDITNKVFTTRLDKLKQIRFISSGLSLVDFRYMTLGEAISYSQELCNDGWEGLFVKTVDHKYLPGKRVNNAIKLKYRLTEDLLCIDVIEGEGKYSGLIGALVLEDKKGRVVQVGSGLSDSERELPPEFFINSIIEISYEQILDTYVQPIFIGIRDDKEKE